MDNYTSDSSDSDSSKTLDLSYLALSAEELDEQLINVKCPEHVDTMLLKQNRLNNLPSTLVRFTGLSTLDISGCGLSRLPDFWPDCPLTCLIAKHNQLTNDGLVKTFENLTSLRELNLSGNRLEEFPDQVLDLADLKYLYLGGNLIREITEDIWKLQR